MLEIKSRHLTWGRPKTYLDHWLELGVGFEDLTKSVHIWSKFADIFLSSSVYAASIKL